MIVLDTNAISETTRPRVNPTVHAWLNNQAPETVYVTSVTIAELLFGVATVPDGKRKTALGATVDEQMEIYGDRILGFNNNAAWHYADLAVIAEQNGWGFPTPDGYIAAIAAAHGFGVASRDTAPFEAADLKVVNPWAAGEAGHPATR